MECGKGWVMESTSQRHEQHQQRSLPGGGGPAPGTNQLVTAVPASWSCTIEIQRSMVLIGVTTLDLGAGGWRVKISRSSVPWRPPDGEGRDLFTQGFLLAVKQIQRASLQSLMMVLLCGWSYSVGDRDQ